MEFPNFGGRIGPDSERASRVYHFAHTQPSWAARMAAFIFGVMLLLVLIVVLLPLILLAVLIVAGLLLVARVRMAFAGGAPAASDRDSLGLGSRLRSSVTSIVGLIFGSGRKAPRTGGRKNVRVRRRDP